MVAIMNKTIILGLVGLVCLSVLSLMSFANGQSLQQPNNQLMNPILQSVANFQRTLNDFNGNLLNLGGRMATSQGSAPRQTRQGPSLHQRYCYRPSEAPGDSGPLVRMQCKVLREMQLQGPVTRYEIQQGVNRLTGQRSPGIFEG